MINIIIKRAECLLLEILYNHYLCRAYIHLLLEVYRYRYRIIFIFEEITLIFEEVTFIFEEEVTLIFDKIKLIYTTRYKYEYKYIRLKYKTLRPQLIFSLPIIFSFLDISMRM